MRSPAQLLSMLILVACTSASSQTATTTHPLPSEPAASSSVAPLAPSCELDGLDRLSCNALAFAAAERARTILGLDDPIPDLVDQLEVLRVAPAGDGYRVGAIFALSGDSFGISSSAILLPSTRWLLGDAVATQLPSSGVRGTQVAYIPTSGTSEATSGMSIAPGIVGYAGNRISRLLIVESDGSVAIQRPDDGFVAMDLPAESCVQLAAYERTELVFTQPIALGPSAGLVGTPVRRERVDPALKAFATGSLETILRGGVRDLRASLWSTEADRRCASALASIFGSGDWEVVRVLATFAERETENHNLLFRVRDGHQEGWLSLQVVERAGGSLLGRMAFSRSRRQPSDG